MTRFDCTSIGENYEDAIKLWRRWHVTTEADIDRRLENFRVLFAYDFGKIENDAITYADTQEIFENGRAELLDELDDYEDKDPARVAACFHARFEYIHPFADGNGRVGRTLLNYWLMIHDHPPVIIHDEDKRAYYDALARYDDAEDLEPMLLFLMRQTERTWKKSLERERRRASQN
ncbi:MAG: Fic family protein [Synergistaceae bacterium]|nr:Fic family protein [Synergistaceae bacterium]